MNHILLISASASADSVSRSLGLKLADKLASENNATITHRNLNDAELPLINDAWVKATFTAKDQRTADQHQVLALGNSYVDELEAAEAVIVATPMYNFGFPAALKAYFDQILLAGRTFQYTESGPIGLISGKDAYLVITSGGVELNSPMDFATPHLKTLLEFIGIPVQHIINASNLNRDKDGEILAAAETAIQKI